MDEAYKRALEKIERAYKTGATELYLGENKLSSLPPEIGKLQKLTKLYLRWNQLSSLPPEIGKLQKLTRLDLQGNRLSSLPPEIGKLQKLTVLNLYKNQLRSLLPEIGNLQNLTTLSLRENQLSSLPPAIGKLQKLTELSLSRNQLSSLPPEIAKLQNLTELDLRSNQLSSLPPEIAKLQNLTELDLRSNQLSSLPPEIGKLQNLTELYLSSNQLSSLPPEIGKLQKLTELYLSFNQLSSLPPEIAKLQNLTSLYLSSNQLSSLPPEIGKLQNLTSLYLDHNQLNNLPHEIGKLQSLKELHLHHNQLNSLPETVQNLKNLGSNQDEDDDEKGLALRGNKFDFPEEIYEKEPQELIQYILNWQEEKNKKPIHEAKVIFLGHGEMGKTSLVNRIIEDRFNPNEEQTKGIEVRDWFVQRGEDKISLHMWDFGGQELMHATHKFFMTKRSLYLLVTNPRRDDKYGESDIDYWMRLIQSYAGEKVPVIVVINKCEEKSSMRKRGVLDEYPQIMDIIETSCKTRRGIDELIARIQEVIQEHKLPHIDDRITEAEYHIKQALEAEKRKGTSYLSYFEYTRICWKADEDIKESMTENLLGLLHDLGVMLNFCHKEQTRAETQVLNPEWVTEGVYAIVNAQHLVDTGGKLCVSTLGELLDKERYPGKKEHQLIMGVMKEFELAYQIGESTEYLVPGSLPEDTPRYLAWEPDGGAQLKFRYTYEILPKSIMSRFIVKMHQSQKEGEGTLWRSGIVLEDRGCEALVQAHPNQGCIDIILQGKGNRVRLLAKIQTHFEEIHRSFEAIGVEAFVWVELRVKGRLREAWVPYEALLRAEEDGRRSIYWFELRGDINVQEVLSGYRWQGGVLDRIGKYVSKVKMLFYASSPTNEAKLQVKEEQIEVSAALRDSQYGHIFHMKSYQHARVSGLREVLNFMPQIVHFSGHGEMTHHQLSSTLSIPVEKTSLVFENDQGGNAYLSGEDVQAFFDPFDEVVECIFLNACHSNGILELLKDKVRYLVGVIGKLPDMKAITFAPAFYKALGQGMGVERAFKVAKNELMLGRMGSGLFRLYVDGKRVG